MSWIIRDLWHELERRRSEYNRDLTTSKVRAYWTMNAIAAEVGKKWGILIQLNFPPDSSMAIVGHENLSMIVEAGRKKFEGVVEAEVGNQLELLDPVSVEPIGMDYQGLKAFLPKGRIDCLPGAVHLWCTITPAVLRLVDWLFTNAYGIEPEGGTKPVPGEK